ncbi:membrane protein [Leptolyngbya sp. Heron Island J]|uniref:DoxX family protein n=1 Tax=Leptolyngbya sp. Heron Island J TaxID=1385935 RepID=UPI0003B95039|nr:membrane protein [Leptolyngbya sp. Heron Island J]ESA33833.1 membrane protein [Leptolyngbya sp. Heron Island J]
MVVLVVLLSVFVVTWGILTIAQRPNRICTAGCIAFAALFLFTGVSHFSLADGMVKMLPEWVPSRYAIIYITGLMEIVLGLGVLRPSSRRISGLVTLAFLICVFPSNIYAALNSVDFGGNVNGPRYLFFRIPLQIFLLLWVWFMAIRRPQHSMVSSKES